MRIPGRLAACAELVNALLTSRIPADALLADYFRRRRFIGSKDKKCIGDFYYSLQRRYHWLQALLEGLGEAATGENLVIAMAAIDESLRSFRHEDLFDGSAYSLPALGSSEIKIFNQARIAKYEDYPDTPPWLKLKLQTAFMDNYQAEITELGQEAPLDLRVNTIKCSRDRLIKILADEHIKAMPLDISTAAVRLAERVPVHSLPAFKEGYFEVQDAGSQLISLFCAPTGGETVVDFCAGAGGKTLALAALMNNKGRIYALDVSEKRLLEAKKRLRRAGVSNAMVKSITGLGDVYLERLKAKADLVLVDAPCSGSGTWRRSPDLKIRLDESTLSEVKEKQKNILNAAAKLVKPGGRLAYVTCSILPEENEAQVQEFLDKNQNFSISPVSAPPEFTESGFLKLSPCKSGTDGFFMCVVERNYDS